MKPGVDATRKGRSLITFILMTHEMKTISTSIDCPVGKVYEFIRNPANLPRWAPGLCRSAAEKDGRWLLETSTGPVEIRFAQENPYGILDHWVKTESGQEMLNPMRVIPNGEGSEVLFTVTRTEGMSEADFARDQDLVRADLRSLGDILPALRPSSVGASPA